MPDPRFVAVVSANGQNYTAFKTLTVHREFGDTISWFQFTCAEPIDQNGAARLVPGTPVTITLGGVLALTGVLTTRAAAFDGESHDVVMAGRSGTGAAANSSMNVTPGNYNNNTLEQAAGAALQPHNVQLNMINPPDIASKPFPYLAVNPGELVNDFIERMASMRGCYMWDDETGAMCVGQGDPNAASVANLREGGNILKATIKLDDQNVCLTYQTYGQQPSNSDPMADRTAQATVTDPNANTTRISVQPAKHVGDSEDMAAAANLEAARSLWQTVEASITVVGWLRPDGSLWNLLENVSVYSPIGFPNGTGLYPKLGIQSIFFSQGPEGTTTRLELKRPELLTGNPYRTNVASNGQGGSGGDAPQAAVADTPDYQSSGVALGHQ